MAPRVSPLALVAPLALALGAACGSPAAESPEPDPHGSLGAARSALTDADPVSLAVTASCTTSAVKGLATQLIDEIQCLRPGTFASIETDPGLTLGSAVFPWLQTPARQALLDAQKQRGTVMTINSALRTLPQQYLLYRWYQTGRCGIGLAASPGTSNHEQGLAVDIDDDSGWRPSMKAHGFVWLGASDPVHFDYKAAGLVDVGGLSVLAFQKLWNRNHPEDPIDEDSSYGPTTEVRLAKAPVGGFPKGADCGDAGAGAPDAAPGGGDGDSGSGSTPAADASLGARVDGEAPGGCAVGGRAARSSRIPGGLGVAGLALALAARRRRRTRRRTRRSTPDANAAVS